MDGNLPSDEKTRSLRALDVVNFLLADVEGGMGPYLAIYLLANEHWNAAGIGMAIAVANIAAVVTQTPAGAFVDWFSKKPWLIVISSLLTGLGCLAIVLKPAQPMVISMQALIGGASSIFTPAIAAISLGLVGFHKLERQMGRNGTFNHSGNVVTAVLSGLAGRYFSNAWIFYLVAALSIAASLSALFIREKDIDNKLARGGFKEGDDNARAYDLRELFRDRRLTIFMVAAVLFHFANSAMLPLVGQLLSLHAPANDAAPYMAACIIMAQTVMIPMSTFSGRFSPTWGRKAVFLIGFIVLPIRGVLYTLNHHSVYLVAVQALDGIGAGIFGVVAPIVIADLTKGTGRFNLMQGILTMAVGIGASCSNAMTGVLVKHFGYDAGFLTLAAIAGVALGFFALAMPETKPPDE